MAKLDKEEANIRADINKRQLSILLHIVLAGTILAFSFGINRQPGSPLSQGVAILGTLLLLVPLLFFIFKRSGRTRNPPAWFVLHALSSAAGVILILFHAAGGSWLSSPGIVLLALVFLVIQGLLARLYTAPLIPRLFARSVASFNFTRPVQTDRQAIQSIIDQKIVVLSKLDSGADEALFSPALHHWLRSPVLAWRYSRLAEQEARLVGARQRAGLLLGWWRRLHLLVAALFFLGLLMHVIIVLFFAGYVAGDSHIYWWHITDWGR